MQLTKKAESLAWIIVWVFILSFVLIWIGTLIWNSKDLIKQFDRDMDLDLLSSSSYSIIFNMDLSYLSDKQEFYLYKNSTWSTFEVKVWELNNEYKYVDKYWNKIIDPLNFLGDIYIRIFQVSKIDYNWEEKTVVKALIRRLNR